MKHQWVNNSSTYRRCAVCGREQFRITKHRWGRVAGYRWRPLAGHCQKPKEDDAMRYICCMGELLRISERNYRRYLESVTAGTPLDLETLGKSLGEVTNVTDLSPEWARDLLDQETRRKRNQP